MTSLLQLSVRADTFGYAGADIGYGIL